MAGARGGQSVRFRSSLRQLQGVHQRGTSLQHLASFSSIVLDFLCSPVSILNSPCKQGWKALSLVSGVRLLFTLVRLCQRALFCRMRPVVSHFKGFGVREEGGLGALNQICPCLFLSLSYPLLNFPLHNKLNSSSRLKSVSRCDSYNPNDAEDRRMRRAMEAENGRFRRQERNKMQGDIRDFAQ